MLDAIQWDTDLICRYDQSGPCYASYPTAAQMHGGVSSFELLQALRDSSKQLRPLSLYVHLPFCAHACYFCACTKVVTKDRGRAQPYLRALEHEIAIIGHHLDSRQTVEQLHLGGGTPTFLSHDELRHLMSQLRQHFNLLDDDSGDYSIEIDPREADWSTMGLLRELGFNRVSLGVQDLDPAVQRAINRLQTLEETRSIIEAARTLQFRSVNVDLIYGLPKQTPHSFAPTLDEIIALQPDRISLFNYTHLPAKFTTQRHIDSNDLPSAADKLAILQGSIDQLSAAGYRYIGLGHFALSDDELACAQEDGRLQRNFLGYTTHGHCDLVGLGVSAFSQIGDLYCQNDNDLTHYQQSLASGQLAIQRGLHCSADDRVRRAVIQQLICNFSLNISEIEQAHGIQFRAYFAEAWPHLEQMAQDKLINLTAASIDVRPVGRLLIRSLCMLFDHYLNQGSPPASQNATAS
ncbi:MAG: oxygen-independent coproporphyrinogen III oxidase [Pseudomonas sp.]|nr:oxygen-independent coproporphyrinogen III oxidase [Pseudomonas sp.]